MLKDNETVALMFWLCRKSIEAEYWKGRCKINGAAFKIALILLLVSMLKHDYKNIMYLLENQK